jgi:hypothetical protein
MVTPQDGLRINAQLMALPEPVFDRRLSVTGIMIGLGLYRVVTGEWLTYDREWSELLVALAVQMVLMMVAILALHWAWFTFGDP